MNKTECYPNTSITLVMLRYLFLYHFRLLAASSITCGNRSASKTLCYKHLHPLCSPDTTSAAPPKHNQFPGKAAELPEQRRKA